MNPIFNSEYVDQFWEVVQHQEASEEAREGARQVENAHYFSKNKSIIPLLSPEDLPFEVPHIDFILGDERWIVKVCSIVIQIPQLKHQFSQVHI